MPFALTSSANAAMSTILQHFLANSNVSRYFAEILLAFLVASGVVPALSKLRTELDPMRVASSGVSELEVLTAIRTALAHPLAPSVPLSL